MRLCFVIMAYNQEAFIRGAISGAFAQDHDDLEILLSDDCSTDGTFAIMQDMAASYTGPHKVVLNRNEPNLGLIGHVNHLFTLTSADYLIYNAGDDVSEPDRARILAQIIAAHRPHYIHSNVQDLHPDGRAFGAQRNREKFADLSVMPLKDLAKTMSHGIGATACWHRDLIGRFGPIAEKGLYEDRVMLFRARLIGAAYFCDQRLVKYRRGQGLSAKNGRSVKSIDVDIATLRQREADARRIFPNDRAIQKALQKKMEIRLREREEMLAALRETGI